MGESVSRGFKQSCQFYSNGFFFVYLNEISWYGLTPVCYFEITVNFIIYEYKNILKILSYQIIYTKSNNVHVFSQNNNNNNAHV